MKHTFINDWAEWVAVDAGGTICEFETEPWADRGSVIWMTEDRFENIPDDNRAIYAFWRNSLQKRDRNMIEVGKKYDIKARAFDCQITAEVKAIDNSFAWIVGDCLGYETVRIDDYEFTPHDKERDDFTAKVMHIAMVDDDMANLLYDSGCRFLGGDE